jgi:hypothetical protein
VWTSAQAKVSELAGKIMVTYETLRGGGAMIVGGVSGRSVTAKMNQVGLR